MPDTSAHQGLPLCTTVGSLLAEDETDLYEGFIWGCVVEPTWGNLSSDGIVTSPSIVDIPGQSALPWCKRRAERDFSLCVLNFILGGMGIAP